MTSKHIYVGLANGSVFVLIGNEPPFNLLPNVHNIGKINFVHYLKTDNVLLIGSEGGKLFIGNVNESSSSQYFSNFYSKSSQVQVFCYQVLRNGNGLEIWRGVPDAKLEVWSYTMENNNHWSSRQVENETLRIDLQHLVYTGPSCYVSKISEPSEKCNSVFVLIGSSPAGRYCICQVDLINKTPLKYWQCLVNDSK